MLEEFADQLWIAEGKCVDFYGFPYPTRSVVVRLEHGDIWLWSPIDFDEDLAQEIEALGPVRHLVSPNKIHHLFLADWQKRFPSAKIWGPSQTIKKRPDLQFAPALTADAPDDWAAEIEQFHITGSLVMDEILFLHHRSQTLIMADFSENFSKTFLDKHWGPRQHWYANIAGIVEGKGHAPLDWRLSFLKRKQLRHFKADVLSRPIEKVIMAHGQLQHSDGAAFLKQSLSWIKDERKNQG